MVLNGMAEWRRTKWNGGGGKSGTERKEARRNGKNEAGKNKVKSTKTGNFNM